MPVVGMQVPSILNRTLLLYQQASCLSEVGPHHTGGAPPAAETAPVAPGPPAIARSLMGDHAGKPMAPPVPITAQVGVALPMQPP